jgi:hypothetical protein
MLSRLSSAWTGQSSASSAGVQELSLKGFYFGRNGKPAPRDAVRKRYGRVRLGHSELTGFQFWDAACDEGKRAVQHVMEIG